MYNFPMGIGLKFKGSWRSYQERILDNLAVHLADKKIHIVAAPGAGKTTLGIEVIARIDKPTLILTPTITIKNQWKQRIAEAFLEDGRAEEVVSTGILKPKTITIITYQALLAAFCGQTDEDAPEENSEEKTEEEDSAKAEKESKLCRKFDEQKAENVIKLLKEAKVGLLCFDEAHHLRKEWWKALNYLTEKLENYHSIALTATPPYDVDGAEWERYETLCGPIDEMISIPELVKNGDLCPHQDFIHFSTLRQEENEIIKKNMEKVLSFLQSLTQEEKLQEAVLAYIEKSSVEAVLDEPEFFISLAAYLKEAGRAIPQKMLDLFGLTPAEVPQFDARRQKIFLTGLFYTRKQGFAQEEIVEKLFSEAKKQGIIFNKTVFLNDSPKIKRQIANSAGKINSIAEIVKAETQTLGKNLRMVILADYIKQEAEDCLALGVYPIWKTLKGKTELSLAILTGTLVVLPADKEAALMGLAAEYKLNGELNLRRYEKDENYIKAEISGKNKSKLTALITELFSRGQLQIIIGTQALLGEGWDAPCINSLILSSTVSSYMLSNQMRGRAIRKDKNNPNKTAAIWHLASIKVLSLREMQKLKAPDKCETNEAAEKEIQLFDYEKLQSRFQGFEAPSFSKPYYIENGIERIFPPAMRNFLRTTPINYLEKKFLSMNGFMLEQSAKREEIKNSWEQDRRDTYAAPKQKLKNGIKTSVPTKNFVYKSGYLYRITFYTITFLCFLAGITKNGTGWEIILILFIIYLALIAKPTFKYLKCSSPEKIMKQIAVVFLETLSAADEIKTYIKKVSITCDKNQDGSIFVAADNLSPEENKLLINCMIEFLDPIANPRYLLLRKDVVAGFKTKDYHSIPAVIGKKKDNLKRFQHFWEKYIGSCEIFYTRTLEGRKLLLKARKEAFSSLAETKENKRLSRFI